MLLFVRLKICPGSYSVMEERIVREFQNASLADQQALPSSKADFVASMR
jgi:hypothetical protein